MQVFFGVLLGTMMLGQAAPNLENIGNARGAAGAVYKLIDMVNCLLIHLFILSAVP